MSAMGSFSMSIRVPTVSGIAFTAIADRLRCRRVTEAGQGARAGCDRPPASPARAHAPPGAHQAGQGHQVPSADR